MTETGPISAPAECRFSEIQATVETGIIRKVFTALDEGTEQLRRELRAAGLDGAYEPEGYLAATLLRKVYRRLCGADPDTLLGGDPRIASAAIQNCRNIARHYWGAEIEATPQPR